MSSDLFKVICIDDEPEFLALMGDYVSHLGYEPVLLEHPRQVFDVLKKNEHKIILIVSDLSMPEVDGVQLRKELLNEYKNIPFAILSGYITRELALQAVENKICAFIDKPASLEKIKEIIEKETKDRVQLLKDEEELLQGFLSDCSSLIEELESLILQLEENPADFEVINRIFGIVHTIKGSSGFFKPDHVHEFAHCFEGVLSQIKSGQLKLTQDVFTILLAGCDGLKILLNGLKEKQYDQYSINDLIAKVSIEKLSQTTIDQQGKSDQTQKASTVVAGGANKVKIRDEKKVSIKLLDEFMEMSGEITVIRNMVKKIVRNLEKKYIGDKDVQMLQDLLEEMHKINSSVQDKVTEIRKEPMKNIYKPLQRTVRDLSQSLSKKISLITEGDEIKVDTTIADVLNNSLIHLIRNSADHGIESVEERLKKGKSEEGSVRLSCQEKGEFIIVKIQDDGKGIDAERVKKKAIENKLVTEDELKNFSEENVLKLIFAPGFSTAAVVTDVSGRGIGMDMVKSSVEALGGKISIQTKKDEGSIFTLELPIPKSVHILNSLLLKISGQVFGIPQDVILRVVPCLDSQGSHLVSELESAHVFNFENKIIPLVDFSKILSSSEQESKKKYIVVLKGQRSIFAMYVDEIIDIEDTVVKKLKLKTSGSEIFQGATFLPEGGLGLIFNSEEVQKKFCLQHDLKGSHSGKSAQTEQNLNQINKYYIFFESLQQKKYCMPLEKIFRIENFELPSSQKSYRQKTAAYRDRMIYFLNYNLEQVKDQSFLTALVFKKENVYYGLLLNKIIDVSTAYQRIDTNIQSEENSDSLVDYQDAVYTSLNSDFVINRFLKNSEKFLKTA